MYFDDLFLVEMPFNIKYLKVGWLDINKKYTNGKCSLDFINKIKNIESLIKNIIYTCGYHNCPFCNNYKSSKEYLIPVTKNDKFTYYSCPEMIIHYIEEHNYLPPYDFIKVVMDL